MQFGVHSRSIVSRGASLSAFHGLVSYIFPASRLLCTSVNGSARQQERGSRMVVSLRFVLLSPSPSFGTIDMCTSKTAQYAACAAKPYWAVLGPSQPKECAKLCLRPSSKVLCSGATTGGETSLES